MIMIHQWFYLIGVWRNNIPDKTEGKVTVEISRAIQFKCEKCGHIQYAEYTLTPGWYEDRAVNEDNILCEYCNHDQHVIDEL